MIVLLAGSHGFLGQHVKTALESAGHEVWCYSRRTNTVGDTCVASADLLINCAGETKDPEKMIGANVTFATDLLRAAHVFKKRLIHVGSIIEDVPGDSLYQTTKRASTQICLSYARGLGVQAAVVRPSTMYGPGDHDSAFLPTLWRAWKEGKPFKVTNEFRGWVHVSDVARAIRLIAENPAMGVGTFEVNSDYIHNLAIVDLFERAAGQRLWNIDLSLMREEGEGWPRHSCSDIWELGWSPRYDIERGVVEFVTAMKAANP